MIMHLILCGLPSCGKTTVGQLLANQLNYPFIDTDRVVESYYERQSDNFLTCRQLFNQFGEVFFRRLEQEAVAALQNYPPSVIATGGGTVLNAHTAAFLKNIGHLVYLKSDSHVIFERIAGKSLPAYLDPCNPKESFSQLIQKRIPIYESVADLEIPILNETPFEIASLILDKLMLKGY
jgi:shikimate kinase